MDDGELETMLLDVESDRAERKASFGDRERMSQAVCAFANDLPEHNHPGVLFVGADDRTGQPTCLPITDQLLRNLAELRSQGDIQPIPLMIVQKRDLLGAEIAVVIVQPSLAPPVRYRGQTWIRVGPRRAVATAEEERRLSERRRSRDLSFDARPLTGATLDDLDLDLFERDVLPGAISPDVLAENERSVTDQLASLRLTSIDAVPTAAGVLVAGVDPLSWLPGAYVQFLRLEGRELIDEVVDSKELTGPLPAVTRQLEELLQLNIRTTVDITSAATEARTPDYPLVALQQITRNALVHRTYEANSPVRVYWFTDRVEIQSPGGPYGQVNAENFGSPGATDYRNPVLAELYKALGYVQRFGIGLALARSALEKNGNPPLVVNVTEQFVDVTIWSAGR